jgi:hypothetical protein
MLFFDKLFTIDKINLNFMKKKEKINQGCLASLPDMEIGFALFHQINLTG